MTLLRETVRSLLRRPALALVAVATLAVGIGAATALWSYLTALVWPTLEAPEPHRLAWLRTREPDNPVALSSYPDFLDYRAAAEEVATTLGWKIMGTAASLDGGDSAWAWIHAVSEGYFEEFGARFRVGRGLAAADHRPDAPPAVVLGPRFWRSHYGRDPAAVGRHLVLGGVAYTIVGVAPEGFQVAGLPADLYLPLGRSDEVTPTPELADRGSRRLGVLVRLAPGVTRETAEAVFQATARGLDETQPVPGLPRQVALVASTRSDYTGDYVPGAAMLLGAVGLLLLLASTNVANLLLARAMDRRRELGVRAALGARPASLATLLVAEGLLLALAGGALGLLLALAGMKVIESYVFVVPMGFGQWSEGATFLAIDRRVLAFAMLVALATGLVTSLAAALKAAGTDPAVAFRAAAGEGGGKLASRSVLVVSQVVLSTLLLAGAVLLGRSLGAALAVDPGFDGERVLLTTFALPRPGGSNAVGSPSSRADLYQQLQDQVAALPGVAAASMTWMPPLWGTRETTLALPGDAREPRQVAYNVVGPGYFETLHIPLLAGRELGRADRAGAPLAVVVSSALAETLWPGAQALGREVELPDLPDPSRSLTTRRGTVVGVVADIRQQSVTDPPRPAFYLTLHQAFRERMTLLTRTVGPPAAFAPSLKTALHRAQPGLAVIEVAPFAEVESRSLFDRRLYAHLAGAFGLLGLGLAATGVGGLVSYRAARRSREMGIRLALGATRADLVRRVLKEAGVLVGLGLAIGLPVALGLSGLLRSQVWGVSPQDPLTFLLIPAVLGGIAILAATLPALRAARTDPRAVLGQE